MNGNQLDFRVAKVPNRERLEQDTLSSCRAGCVVRNTRSGVYLVYVHGADSQRDRVSQRDGVSQKAPDSQHVFYQSILPHRRSFRGKRFGPLSCLCPCPVLVLPCPVLVLLCPCRHKAQTLISMLMLLLTMILFVFNLLFVVLGEEATLFPAWASHARRFIIFVESAKL